jgi:hypothetical protein
VAAGDSERGNCEIVLKPPKTGIIGVAILEGRRPFIFNRPDRNIVNKKGTL